MKRNGSWKEYLHYRKVLRQKENHRLRINFLENCLKANIVPRFLKFRIPVNGCFEDKAVLEFQLRLLRKEIYSARGDLRAALEKLEENRNKLKQKVKVNIIPSIILHTRYDNRTLRRELVSKLNAKLSKLSNEQEKPLFNVDNTVICYELPNKPPKYVIDTLSLGPRNSILD